MPARLRPLSAGLPVGNRRLLPGRSLQVAAVVPEGRLLSYFFDVEIGEVIGRQMPRGTSRAHPLRFLAAPQRSNPADRKISRAVAPGALHERAERGQEKQARFASAGCGRVGGGLAGGPQRAAAKVKGPTVGRTTDTPVPADDVVSAARRGGTRTSRRPSPASGRYASGSAIPVASSGSGPAARSSRASSSAARPRSTRRWKISTAAINSSRSASARSIAASSPRRWVERRLERRADQRPPCRGTRGTACPRRSRQRARSARSSPRRITTPHSTSYAGSGVPSGGGGACRTAGSGVPSPPVT